MPFTSPRRALPLAVTAKALSFLGDLAAMTGLALAAQSRGADAGQVALLLIANLAPIALLAGPVGRLVDRANSRILLACSSVGQAVVVLGLVVVRSPVAVLVLVGALGLAQAINGATWQALIPSLVPPERLSHALSLAQAGTTLAGVAAPAIGGVLTGWRGVGATLVVAAASYALVTAAALVVPSRRGVPRAHGQSARAGFTIIATTPMLRAVVLMLGSFVLLGSIVNVVEVFLVRESLGAGTTAYGVAVGAVSLGLLTGALSMGRLSGVRRHARGLVVTSAVLGMGIVLMGVAPNIGYLIVFGVITGAANGALNVSTGVLVLGIAAEHERGRVAAALNGVVSGAQLVAYAIGGALAAAMTPREIFVLAGCLGMLAPVVGGRSVLRAAKRQVDKSPPRVAAYAHRAAA